MMLVWAMICFLSNRVRETKEEKRTKTKQTQIQIDKQYYIKLRSFFTEKKIQRKSLWTGRKYF